MTIEEFNKIPFQFISNISMENEYIITYASSDKKFWIYKHIFYKNDESKRKNYIHYRIDRKIYKSRKKFIEAIKEL